MPRGKRRKKRSNSSYTYKHIQSTNTSRRVDPKKVFKAILVLIVLILVIIFAVKFFTNKTQQNEPTEIANSEETTENKTEVKTPTKKDTTFTITALGDILCHNTQYFDAYNSSTGLYDFSYCFEDIKNYTQAGDLTISNLETSFAGEERGYSNYPTFNSPDSLATAMKDIGVDIITTAGNHCLDMGYSGLERTIDVLDQAGISHLGTYKSQEERDIVFIKEVKGVKIAFVDYTYGTNGIPVPSGKGYCVNLIDKDLIKSDIEKAKATKPDVIIACMHWGTEYRTTANDEQIDLSNFLFQNGVDVILGNHPHVLEPMEKRNVTLSDGTEKECFVIYALGNFTADQNYENTRNSIILDLTLTVKSDGKISIDSAKYTPIYMYKNKAASIHKFRVLDLEQTLADYEAGNTKTFSSSDYSYLSEQLEKINSIVGPEF